MTRRRRTTVALAGASLLALAVGLVPANAAAPPQLSERERRASTVVKPAPAPRADVPADRYDLAGGCYALGTGGRWVVRTAGGFAATAPTPQAAEPFHLQATDLGSYLLYGRAADFLAASGARVVAATTPSPDADFVLRGTGRAATLVLAELLADGHLPAGAGRARRRCARRARPPVRTTGTTTARTGCRPAFRPGRWPSSATASSPARSR